MLQCKKSPTLLLLLSCLFFLLPSLYGQSDSARLQDDPLVVKVAVIGPGDELYFWWGHIGLVIENRSTGASLFYDWGVFSFDNENFFVNFAFGRLIYACAVSPTEWNIHGYYGVNRDITFYTLDLAPEVKDEIRRFGEWSVRPENRDYFYHHFDDNCATRVRDIIDTATGGQFRAKYENTAGRFTFRQHVRRHTWFNPFFDWLLNFLMGRGIDQPVTVWEEMFLPSEIAMRINEFRYIDSSGVERNLVSNVEIINQSVGRPAVLDTPRNPWRSKLAVSLIMSAAIALLLYLRGRGNKKADYAWAITQGILGFFFGLAGSMLFFMTFFTNHDYTYQNINILFVNPLLLAALPFAVFYCKATAQKARRRWELMIKAIWSWVIITGLISIVINIFFGQMNLADISLILPVSAVLSLLPDLAKKLRRR